jgi:hypothetical protein
MNAKGIMLAGVLAPLILTGCLMVPGPHGTVAFVPPLPPIVVLGPEPYYVNDGYHYHYHNNAWLYARSPNGPWQDLPRDHYPREVQFRNGGEMLDGGQKQEYRR